MLTFSSPRQLGSDIGLKARPHRSRLRRCKGGGQRKVRAQADVGDQVCRRTIAVVSTGLRRHPWMLPRTCVGQDEADVPARAVQCVRISAAGLSAEDGSKGGPALCRPHMIRTVCIVLCLGACRQRCSTRVQCIDQSMVAPASDAFRQRCVTRAELKFSQANAHADSKCDRQLLQCK